MDAIVTPRAGEGNTQYKSEFYHWNKGDIVMWTHLDIIRLRVSLDCRMIYPERLAHFYFLVQMFPVMVSTIYTTLSSRSIWNRSTGPSDWFGCEVAAIQAVTITPRKSPSNTLLASIDVFMVVSTYVQCVKKICDGVKKLPVRWLSSFKHHVWLCWCGKYELPIQF